MASAAPGILTAQATPEVARRGWPRWLLLGLAMLAVGTTAVFWHPAGARVLLGATGLFLAGRGVVLLAGRLRGAGAAAVVVGVAAAGVAVLSAALAARALLVAVPLVLLGVAGGLLARGGTARRGGTLLLCWSVLVTGLLVAAGVGQGWSRAADVATVVAGLAAAAAGVPVLIGAARLRAAAARPAPAPSPCAGCACGAGGCGALG